MSKLSELKGRIHALGEIKSILGAMKSLSIIEMNKVNRYLGAQSELARTIEEALADFERFFAADRGRDQEGAERLLVLLGSERGFCGGYNEAVLKRFEEQAASERGPVRALVVGRKLASKLEGDPRVVESLEGPNSAEEIAGAIAELALRLSQVAPGGWTLIHHEDGDARGRVVAIDPFALPQDRPSAQERFAPLLNLEPRDLYPQLLEQYLYSVLYKAFYLSFLAENRERLRHMEGALSALDREWSRMKRRSNALRQEEITEELEVILLSVDA
jgi:F-type H+-transporting ATPase subunit gamma